MEASFVERLYYVEAADIARLREEARAAHDERLYSFLFVANFAFSFFWRILGWKDKVGISFKVCFSFLFPLDRWIDLLSVSVISHAMFCRAHKIGISR